MERGGDRLGQALHLARLSASSASSLAVKDVIWPCSRCSSRQTRSGRELDKLAGVKTSMGQQVACVTLDESPVVYECKVVHHNDVMPGTLMPDITSRAYPQGDFHRLYYGQIMGTFAK